MDNFLYLIIGALGGSILFGGIGYFIIGRLKKTAEFLIMHEKSYNYGKKHPRKKMIFFTIKFWAVIFVVSFFSFSILWFAMIPIWLMIGFVLYYFLKSWKYHGYSLAVLILSTGLLIALDFIINFPLRNIIYYDIILPYVFKK